MGADGEIGRSGGDGPVLFAVMSAVTLGATCDTTSSTQAPFELTAGWGIDELVVARIVADNGRVWFDTEALVDETG